MNRTKLFAINSISAIALQLVSLAVGLITPRIMLYYYGSEINGLISSLTQFFSYFMLVEAGLAGASIYALYKPLANRDTESINAIVTATKIFYTKAGYLFVLLTVSLAVTYPFIVKTAVLNYSETFILVFLLGVSGFIDFFTLSKYRALLTADQKMYVISIATCVHLAINTIITYMMAVIGADIIVLKTIALCSVFARTLILIIYSKKKYSYLKYDVQPDYQALNKRGDAFYLQILGALHTGAPILIITIVLQDLKLASVFAIFNMVMSGIGSLLGVFTSGLSASFGDVIARNESETLKRAYSEFELFYYCSIAIVYAVSFVLIQPFVDIYTAGITDANYHLPILGILFVLNGITYSAKTPQGMMVISAGHYKETKVQTTIQGLIMVVLGVVLSFKYGIYGVMVACILSNFYRDIDLLIYVPNRIVKSNWKESLIRVMIMIASIILSVIACSIVRVLVVGAIDNYGSWVFAAIVFTIIAAAITISCYAIFSRAVFIRTVRRIASLFHH